VDDAIGATLRAADAGTAGRAYNVGTGTSISVGHLAERVTRAVDSDSEVVYADRRPGEVTHSRAAVDRLREDLDYRPTVDVREGLESVIEALPGDAILMAD